VKKAYENRRVLYRNCAIRTEKARFLPAFSTALHLQVVEVVWVAPQFRAGSGGDVGL
jgi:hypothetical protein